jgi:hypothetical protein
MTYQNRDGLVPGAARRANDPDMGRWDRGAPERSQAHDYHGYGGDPMRGIRLPFVPDYDRTFIVADMPALSGGQESGELVLKWPHGGIVQEMALTVLGIPPADPGGVQGWMTNFAIKITVGDGRESIFVQGGTTGNTSTAYTSFAGLCGANGERRFLLKRPVYPTLSWTIEVKNIGSSELALTPEVLFFMDSDTGDVRRHFFKKISVPAGTAVEVWDQQGNVHEIDTSHHSRGR